MYGREPMGDGEQSQLIEQSLSGNTEAFGRLLRLHEEALAALIVRLVPDPHHADDVMQEAMLQAWRSLAQLRDPGRFKPWLLQIARHRCGDHWRSRQRRESPAGSDVLDRAANRLGRGLAESDGQETNVAEAMRDLPASQGESLRLFYFEGMSIAEISRRMERPSGTIKRWLHHGRRALRQSLGGRQQNNSGDRS